MCKLANKVIVTCILIFVTRINAQTYTPCIIFKDDSQTHNMHITSDGEYLYTCNGGKAELGQISRFGTDGCRIATFKINLDMRSILYNQADKKLYVITYGQKVCRIDDLSKGEYHEVLSFSDRNEQCSPALSPDGKQIYFMELGRLYVYYFNSGVLKKVLSGFDTADNAAGGGTTVAVDKKHIYIWKPVEKTVLIYNLKGKFLKSVKLSHGDYGFSLSFANDFLWVSADGNYEEGTWYGYVIK